MYVINPKKTPKTQPQKLITKKKRHLQEEY